MHENKAAEAINTPAHNNEELVIEENDPSDVSVNFSDITSESEGNQNPRFIVFCGQPACCIEMCEELEHFLVKQEKRSGRDYNMMSRHPGLEPIHRSFLLDWMMEMCEFFNVSRDTYSLALDYADRYLSVSSNYSREQLQLVGMTCLLIASKWEEVNSIVLTDLIYLADDIFSEEQVLIKERQILKALDCRSAIWTLNKWLFTLLHVSGYELNPVEYILLVDLLDLITLDLESLKFSYSVLASACIYLVTSLQLTFPDKAEIQLLKICECVIWIQKYWDTLRERLIPECRLNLLPPYENKCKIVKYSVRQSYSNLLEMYVTVNRAL